jgi:hypothetical protein
MNTENPKNGDDSPDEEPKKELSLYEDPESIFFVDPNEEEVELSLGDTQEFTLDDAIPNPADSAPLITLDEDQRDALIECVKSSLRIISTYIPDDEYLEDGRETKEARLLAYYKKEIAHHLIQDEMVTRSHMLQRLEGNPAPGFPNFDEDMFHFAFNAVWQINANYGMI